MDLVNKELIIIIPEDLMDKKQEIQSELNKYYQIWISPEESIDNTKERKRVFNLFCEEYLVEQLNKKYQCRFSSTTVRKEV